MRRDREKEYGIENKDIIIIIEILLCEVLLCLYVVVLILYMNNSAYIFLTHEVVKSPILQVTKMRHKEIR